MPHLLSLLAAFVAVSVALGVVAAGIFIPAVGAFGKLSNTTIDSFESIPDDLGKVTLAQQSRIYDAGNNVIATPYDQNRIIVTLKNVAPIMRKAQVAIEDSRFYEHGALDVRGTMRALINNASEKATQGGSSLTQQYVKLTLQEEALARGDETAAREAVSVNYARKLREMRLAMHVEETMTKNQILQGYLNLAYYGDLAYGIEAAAHHYFDVSAKELNLSQAATLAGVVQSPGTSDPHNFPEVAEYRRNVVLDRMVRVGVITAKEAAAAKKPSVRSMLRIRDDTGGTCAKSSQPFFCQYVMDYMLSLPSLGENKAERLIKINRYGLKIKTTLRSDWQRQIYRQLTSLVPNGDPSGVGAGAAVVEPGTGKLLAMVQTSQFDVTGKKSTTARTSQSWIVPIKYGGTRGFPIGSTAKIYTIVTALEKGWPVEGMISAPPAGPSLGQGHVFPTWGYKDECMSPKPWEVRNDFLTKETAMTFRYATANSINTAFAAAMISLGGCEVRKTMTKMGLLQGNGEQITTNPSDLVLGSGSVPPLTMANSIATLAADGKYCPVSPIVSIEGRGKTYKLPANKCKQVISAEVARGTTELLRGVLTNGTGTRARNFFARPAAGKTGTHEDHMQSWFVGYTPQLATAVWVGTPITSFPMEGWRACIGGRCYTKVFGGDIAAPLWGQIMNYISANLPWADFPRPSYATLYGNQVALPSVIGMSADAAIATLRAAGFDAVVQGTQNSTMAAGLVVATAPSGTAAQGTTVGLYTSTGFVPPPPTVDKPPANTSTPPPSSTPPGNGPSTPPGNTSTKPGGTETIDTPPPNHRTPGSQSTPPPG